MKKSMSFALSALAASLALASPAQAARDPEGMLGPEQRLTEIREILDREVIDQIARAMDFQTPIFTNIETNLHVGKNTAGEFSDYLGSTEGNIHLPETDEVRPFRCNIHARVSKVPFAKQPGDVIILEQVINDFQIIARIRVACRVRP